MNPPAPILPLKDRQPPPNVCAQAAPGTCKHVVLTRSLKDDRVRHAETFDSFAEADVFVKGFIEEFNTPTPTHLIKITCI